MPEDTAPKHATRAEAYAAYSAASRAAYRAGQDGAGHAEVTRLLLASHEAAQEWQNWVRADSEAALAQYAHEDGLGYHD